MKRKVRTLLVALSVMGLLVSCGGKEQKQDTIPSEVIVTPTEEVQENPITDEEEPLEALEAEEPVKQSNDMIDALLTSFQGAVQAYANENRFSDDEVKLESYRKKAFNLLNKIEKLSGKMTSQQLQRFESIQAMIPPDAPDGM